MWHVERAGSGGSVGRVAYMVCVGLRGFRGLLRLFCVWDVCGLCGLLWSVLVLVPQPAQVLCACSTHTTLHAHTITTPPQ